MQGKINKLLELPGVSAFMAGTIDYNDIPESTRAALYEHLYREMPYGVAKARTGDPDQWIADWLEAQTL